MSPFPDLQQVLDDSVTRNNHNKHYQYYMLGKRESKCFHIGERDFEVQHPPGMNPKNLLRDHLASIPLPPEVTVSDISDKVELDAVSVLLRQAASFRPSGTKRHGGYYHLKFDGWECRVMWDRRDHVLEFLACGESFTSSAKPGPVHAALTACRSVHYKRPEKIPFALSVLLWFLAGAAAGLVAYLFI